MTKRIEEMTRDEFTAHMQARVDKMLADALLDDDTAAHWNSMHPDEQPLPTDAAEFVKALLKKTFKEMA